MIRYQMFDRETLDAIGAARYEAQQSSPATEERDMADWHDFDGLEGPEDYTDARHGAWDQYEPIVPREAFDPDANLSDFS